MHQSVLIPQNIQSRSHLEIMWMKIPVTFNAEDTLFTSYSETRKLFVNEKLFPVNFRTQHMQSFVRREVMLNEDEAEKILRSELSLYKLFNLKNAEDIEEKSEIVKDRDKLILTATVKCRENIAVKEKLVVNQ